jgi:hypothetical protein
MAALSHLWPAARRNLWKTLAHQLGELPFQELKDVASFMGPFAVEMDTMPPYNKHEKLHVKLAANMLNCEIQSVQNVLAMVCTHARYRHNDCSHPSRVISRCVK